VIDTLTIHPGVRRQAVRLRVRYRDLVDPWFDYLLVSPSEMESLLDGTGWRIDRIIPGDPLYVAVLT
jgi:hypothetical protein